MAILAQLVDDVVVHKFDLKRTALSLGRHPSNDVVVNESAVSSHHARIYREPNPHFPQYQEVFIEDLGSTNGTFVNEIKISGKQRLHHNDVVRLAWNKFQLIDPEEVDMGKTVHMVEATSSKI